MSRKSSVVDLSSRRSFMATLSAIGGGAACLALAPLAESHAVGPVHETGITATINTIIGGGPVGNKLATECALATPFALSFDGAGNLYMTDNYYHRVYRVSAATGILTTVAGSGIPGFSGDGGPAVNASLNFPYGMDVDAAGNIGIGDANNNRIRYVSGATGVISTVAGTGKSGYNGDGIAASTALLAGPHGVALGVAGVVYIADSNNNRIRVVNQGAAPVIFYPNGKTPVTILPGQIGTIAGTGVAGYSGDGGPATQAQVNLPWGLLIGLSTNLFIADYYGQRVRKINLLTGIITTIAGIGVQGHTGDGGPATQAAITFPTTLALDSAGNLYIGQEQANTVRMVAAATGIITTVAGTGVSGTSGDGGPAIDAEVNSPTGVAVDSAGNFYIAEYNGGRVRRVDGITQIITTEAGSTNFGDGLPALEVNLNQPVGFSFDPQGRMTFSDQANQEIRVMSASGIITAVAGTGVSGYNGDGIPAAQAQINIPADAQFDSSGNLFICDRGNARIRRVDAVTGLISTVAGNGQVGYGGDGGPATQALLNQARAILIDTANNLWIAELDNFRVRYVNLSSQPVTLFGAGPVPLTVGPGIIVTAAGTGVSGSAGDGGPCVDAQVNSPRGVTMDSQGNIYVTEGGRDPQNLPGPNVVPDSKIRKIDGPTGIISTVAGTQNVGYNGDGIPATQANLNGPRNVAVDAAGNIYIADSLNNRIRRVDFQTGLISTLVGGSQVGFAGDGGGLAGARICTPRYVRLDLQGNLIFSDDGNSRYRKISFG